MAFDGEGLVCRIQLFGPAAPSADCIVLRDRNRVGAEYRTDIQLQADGADYLFALPLDKISTLSPSRYLVLVRHSEYDLSSPKGQFEEVRIDRDGKSLCLRADASNNLELIIETS